MLGTTQLQAQRQGWMAVLARATAEQLAAALPHTAPAAGWTPIRGPEVGMVMLQGRAGGTGAPFNLGEATVARCTVRLASGTIGHAYRMGRDRRAAELAAVLDALLQDAPPGAPLHAAVAALGTAQADARATEARRAAATEVQFFAMETMRS